MNALRRSAITAIHRASTPCSSDISDSDIAILCSIVDLLSSQCEVQVELVKILDKMPKPIVLEQSPTASSLVSRIVSLLAQPTPTVHSAVISAVDTVATSQWTPQLFAPEVTFVLQALKLSHLSSIQERAKSLITRVGQHAMEVCTFPLTASSVFD
jgi:hypothetical protein